MAFPYYCPANLLIKYGYGRLKVWEVATMLKSMKKSAERLHVALGENIAARRKKLGLNQETMAHDAKIGISALKDIERGVSEGTVKTRLAIAKFLKCRLGDLYFSPDEVAAVTNAQSARADLILGIIAGLPSVNDKELRSIARSVNDSVSENLPASRPGSVS